MNAPVYLDNSATTQVIPPVAETVHHLLTNCYGNPSSLHSMGYEAQLCMDRARRQTAKALGCGEGEITFTSGATEANNLALLGAAQTYHRRGNRIVATAFEHASCLSPLRELEKQGFEVCYIRPDREGHISVAEFLEAIHEDTFLISCMMVNNEIGVIQPLEELVRKARRKRRDLLIHCDAVQAFGKLPLQAVKLDVDFLTVSGHKVHAPKGVGALYKKKGIRLLPRTFGGEQERGLRPGTENIACIAGLGTACEQISLFRKEHFEKVSSLWRLLRQEAGQISGLILHTPADALPYILNLSAPGIRSEIFLHYLEQRQIYVSSGSACAKGEKSHVLRSMGLSDGEVDSALRISLSFLNTEEDISRLLEALRDGLREIRR